MLPDLTRPFALLRREGRDVVEVLTGTVVTVASLADIPDESLSLVIEVPIQQKWVGNKPALQGLVGQVMQIPVHGTFAQPKVDERAITGFVGQAAQAAAGGLLGGELNKALDKLLKPR